MVFKTPEGVEIIKTFTFTQGQYPIVVKHQVVNRSQQNWQGQMFGQLKRDNSEDPGKSSQGIFTLGTFLGGAWGTRMLTTTNLSLRISLKKNSIPKLKAVGLQWFSITL